MWCEAQELLVAVQARGEGVVDRHLNVQKQPRAAVNGEGRAHQIMKWRPSYNSYHGFIYHEATCEDLQESSFPCAIAPEKEASAAWRQAHAEVLQEWLTSRKTVRQISGHHTVGGVG